MNLNQFSLGFKLSLIFICIFSLLNLKRTNIKLSSLSEETVFKWFLEKQLLSFGVNGAVDVGSEVTHKNRTMNV